MEFSADGVVVVLLQEKPPNLKFFENVVMRVEAKMVNPRTSKSKKKKNSWKWEKIQKEGASQFPDTNHVVGKVEGWK